METLGIVIPTYQRNDGKTPFYLERALNSIKDQTNQNYHVYLIGDKYENDNEFINLATSTIQDNKITYINLPNAIEREKYINNKLALWNCGGANASNYGIDLAVSEGINYICRLDHDDWWEKNHLELISENLNDNIFIATKSTYVNGRILPRNFSNPYYPQACNLIHSSTCIKFSEIPLRYRDMYEEEKRIYPSDADMWNRLSDYMVTNNKKGYLIDVITCNHVEEGK